MENLLCSDIEKVLNNWRNRAEKYEQLSHNENDPIGQKFYETSWKVLSYCFSDIQNVVEQHKH